MARRKSPSELRRDNTRMVDIATDKLLRRIAGIQNEMYHELRDALSGLDINADNRLVFNRRNAYASTVVDSTVRTFNQTEMPKLIRFVVREIERIVSSSGAYYRRVTNAWNVQREQRLAAELLLKLGYDRATGTVIAGGWVDSLFATNMNLAGVVARDVNNAIGAQMPKREFFQQFRQSFTGQPPNGAGYLQRYYRTFVNDIFSQTNNNAALATATELGIDQYAIYSGTTIKTTREFCRRRVGNMYTRDEIESWNGQTWKGKNPNADVKLVCGGYNCRHTLSWISTELAEEMRNAGRAVNAYN